MQQQWWYLNVHVHAHTAVKKPKKQSLLQDAPCSCRGCELCSSCVPCASHVAVGCVDTCVFLAQSPALTRVGVGVVLAARLCATGLQCLL